MESPMYQFSYFHLQLHFHQPFHRNWLNKNWWWINLILDSRMCFQD